MKAAIIPADPDQPVRVEETERIDLDFLSGQVGGYIEAVGLDFAGDGEGALTMYLNEEGKLDGLPFNPRATILALGLGAIRRSDYIAGTAVVVGPADEEGYETGLDEEAAEAFLTMFSQAE
jgi:hypothetical protein